MARFESKKVPRKALETDAVLLARLSGIPGYKPTDAKLSIEAIRKAHDAYTAATAKVTAAIASHKDGSQEVRITGWAFHNLMLLVKHQVVAQFGENSDEMTKLGLKKKSERKSPRPKTAVKPAPAVSPVAPAPATTPAPAPATATVVKPAA